MLVVYERETDYCETLLTYDKQLSECSSVFIYKNRWVTM